MTLDHNNLACALTSAQSDHFRTFGFAILRGYLADRIAMLDCGPPRGGARWRNSVSQ